MSYLVENNENKIIGVFVHQDDADGYADCFIKRPIVKEDDSLELSEYINQGNPIKDNKNRIVGFVLDYEHVDFFHPYETDWSKIKNIYE